MYKRHHSEETRKKIREKHLGIKWSDEQKKRMSEQRKGVKRTKPISEESRKKMSESAKRRMSNPENNPMYGKHHSEESKLKNRISHLKSVKIAVA